MDVDTTRKGFHAAILDAFGNGEADILLGTQMIAKGLDFSKCDVSGCLECGYFKFTGLSILRANLSTLDSGGRRAGRAEKEGRGYHSELQPQSICDLICQNQDYEGFLPMKCRFAGS